MEACREQTLLGDPLTASDVPPLKRSGRADIVIKMSGASVYVFIY